MLMKPYSDGVSIKFPFTACIPVSYHNKLYRDMQYIPTMTTT